MHSRFSLIQYSQIQSFTGIVHSSWVRSRCRRFLVTDRRGPSSSSDHAHSVDRYPSSTMCMQQSDRCCVDTLAYPFCFEAMVPVSALSARVLVTSAFSILIYYSIPLHRSNRLQYRSTIRYYGHLAVRHLHTHLTAQHRWHVFWFFSSLNLMVRLIDPRYDGVFCFCSYADGRKAVTRRHPHCIRCHSTSFYSDRKSTVPVSHCLTQRQIFFTEAAIESFFDRCTL